MYSPIRGGSISPIERAHTPTASDFPVPASQEFKVTKRDKGLVSPSQSSFSFIDEEDQPIHAITSPRRIESRTPSRGPSRAPSRKNSVDLSRARGASIDGAAGYLCNGIADNDVVLQAETGKTRNQFYTEVFSYREPNITPKDRIYSDAIVTVEVKTNVIVHDEYALLLSLSSQLSRLYHRPTTSIFLSLSHSACMLFGGTFDSAYILTITSLPLLLSPTNNKKNSALLQAFLAESLGVSPARGVVRFWKVRDEDLAFSGTTVGGQIENLKRDELEQEKEIKERGKEEVASRPPLLKKQQSTKSYKMVPSNHNHHTSAWLGTQSVPVSRAATPPCLPRLPVEKGGWAGAGAGAEKGGWGEKKGEWGEKKGEWGEKKGEWGEKKGEWGEKKGRLLGREVGGRVVGKRKSFFNIFGSRGREGGGG